MNESNQGKITKLDDLIAASIFGGSNDELPGENSSCNNSGCTAGSNSSCTNSTCSTKDMFNTGCTNNTCSGG